ncbi:TonB-dependent receptor [Inquilinus sp. KBS0705]|nr:TonB-dependent receptor [Inquilinus sp. KBS0705]
MKFYIGCLLIAFITGLCSFCYGQSSSSVHGNVFIQHNLAAEAATVILLNQPDSSVALSALVNNKGAYAFLNVQPGSYILLVTRLGYKKYYTGSLQVVAGQNLTVNPIELSPASNELKEVSVVSRRPFIEVKPGKTTINPSASIAVDGKNALDVLRQSPGVRVDNGISLIGRQNALVLIDGKQTNLSSTEVADLLAGTQANTIDRIELITGASAKYDASAGGIVNIVMKKGKNIGFNGTYTASAGMGRYYKLNTGITFNNRTKNTNIFGNYSIADNKNYSDILTDRFVNDAGAVSNYQSTYHNIQKNINHNFRLGADFNLSTNSTIGFLVSGNLNENDFAKNNTLKIKRDGLLDSTIIAITNIERDLNSFNYNINYNNKLNKAGENLSANITYTNTPRRSEEYIENTFYDAIYVQYRSPLLLQNLSPSSRYNWTGKIDYANPLQNGAKLEAGAKISVSNSDNNLVFGPKIGDAYISDPTYSNHFIYKENVSSGYLNYNKTLGKIDIETGLRGEYTTTSSNSIGLYTSEKIENHYFNLFPSATLTYHKNDKNDFSLLISRGLERPDYEKLNPFLYFLDLYTYQSGNPYLKPEYVTTATIGYTYNQSISVSLYGSHNNGSKLPFYIQNDSSGINILTTRNLGTITTYGIKLDLPVTFTPWWGNNFAIDASHQQYKAFIQNGNLNQGVIDVVFTGRQDFKISKSISASFLTHYETPTWYGINHFKASYSFDTEIGKSVLNKRGKLSFSVRDIFNTVRDRYHTDYQNNNLSQIIKFESRSQQFRLNFSYNFGKTTVKSAPKRDIGNEDEQARMKTTSN